MSLSVWSFPTRILFGTGAVAEVGNESRRLGGHHAFVCTDRGVLEAGLVDDIEKSLRQVKMTWEVFTGISSNPIEAEVEGAARAFKEKKCDLVIAIGGGSPLDVAKLVRLRQSHDLPLAEYDDAKNGGEKIVNPMPPMVAIPTTAGTGSEVGRSGVVTLEKTKKKTVIFAPPLIPNVAILDPQMTVTMPPHTTAATGFDALTHNIEAYCALGHHPMADAIALKGLKLVGQYLERAVKDGKDIEARAAMLEASMMGAVAFQKGLGACHSLAHPLSAELGLHHGLANALCLPAVLDFNRSAVQDHVARVALLLGAAGDDHETLAFEASGAIRALRRRCGLPEGLSQVGVEEAALPHLAQLAMEDACHSLNPRPCTVEDMLSLYRASM